MAVPVCYQDNMGVLGGARWRNGMVACKQRKKAIAQLVSSSK